METHLLSGNLRDVRPFGLKRSVVAGDRVQFEAEGSRLIQSERQQLLHRQIPAQISVKFPVGLVSWIPVSRGPHRQGCFTVPTEKGNSIAAADRGIDPITRAGPGMQQTMAIKHGVAQPRIPHPMIKPFVVSALRQPDPQGSLSDQTLVFPHSGAELTSHRLGMLSKQRQVAVGRSAGEQINHVPALQCGEPSDQIRVAGLPGLQMTMHCDRQMFRSFLQPRMRFRQQVQSRLNPGRKAMFQISICKER